MTDRTLKGTRRRLGFAYLLLAPSVVLLAVVVAYPVFSSFWMSFTDRNLLRMDSGRFIGLENYTRVFADPNFQQAVGNTAIWTVVNVVAQVVLGLGIAVMLNRNLIGAGLFRSVAIIPWVVPSVAAVLIWRYMYDPAVGLFNSLLMKLGIISEPVVFLGDPSTALPAVMVESIWKGTPFVVIILLAGLQAVTKEEYEAAAVDGASSWSTFWSVVLPRIRPTLALATVLTTVYTINNFNAIWLMTGGGPVGSTEIVFTYGYKRAFVDYAFGTAAAVSVVLFAVLLGLTLIYLAVLDRGDD